MHIPHHVSGATVTLQSNLILSENSTPFILRIRDFTQMLEFVGLNNWYCGIFFQLSMNFKRGFVKFGLLHMIATNICIWSITVIQEVSGSYLLYKDMTDEFMKSRQAGTGNTKMASGQQGPAYTVDNKGNT